MEGATAPCRFNNQRRSLTPAPLPSGRGVSRAPRHNRDASPLLPDGRRWRGAPDEGLPFQWKAQRLRRTSCNKRRSLTPAPLPSGRGVPRALSRNRDASPLLPDRRRWRGAPDEGLPPQQGGATAPSRFKQSAAVPHPCPSPIRERGSPRPSPQPRQDYPRPPCEQRPACALGLATARNFLYRFGNFRLSARKHESHQRLI